MSRHYRRIGFVVVAFIFAVAWEAPLAESQDAVGQMTQEMAPSGYRAPDWSHRGRRDSAHASAQSLAKATATALLGNPNVRDQKP